MIKNSSPSYHLPENVVKDYKFICLVCGKEFYNNHPPGNKNSPKYCSKECSHEGLLRWQRKNKGRLLTEDGNIKCLVCKKEFKFVHHGKHTCSDKCDEIRRKKTARDWSRKTRYGGSIGNIDVPDATFYQNYKLPVRKVEKGFGYYGVLMYSRSLDRIQCHVCGEWFRALYGGYKGHLNTHKMEKSDYLEEFGLNRNTKLICEGLREKMIKNYERRYKTGEMKKYEKNLEAFQETKYKRTMTGKRIRLEARNERGNCPDQLLDKIKKTAEANNGVVSQPKMHEIFGSSFGETIKQTFGSWENAVHLTGYLTGKERPDGTYSDIELLAFLKNFYDEHKRTPVGSDFRRGYLPGLHAYRDRFGNLNEARRRAGIPQLVMYGRGHWLEAKNLKETLSTYQK